MSQIPIFREIENTNSRASDGAVVVFVSNLKLFLSRGAVIALEISLPILKTIIYMCSFTSWERLQTNHLNENSDCLDIRTYRECKALWFETILLFELNQTPWILWLAALKCPMRSPLFFYKQLLALRSKSDLNLFLIIILEPFSTFLRSWILRGALILKIWQYTLESFSKSDSTLQIEYFSCSNLLIKSWRNLKLSSIILNDLKLPQLPQENRRYFYFTALYPPTCTGVTPSESEITTYAFFRAIFLFFKFSCGWLIFTSHSLGQACVCPSRVPHGDVTGNCDLG